MTDRTWWEKIETKGEAALEQLKRLIAEGNVRRVRIRQKDHVVAEFPLTIGVVGAVLAPVVAAVGAVAALMTDCTIEVERQENVK
jgi:VanZ family protein